MTNHAPDRAAPRFAAGLTTSRAVLFPAMADLAYITGLVSSTLTDVYAGLVLVGVAGIAANLAKGYQRFLAGRASFPFWWLLPCLAVPWLTLFALCRGVWERKTQAPGSVDRFRSSATALGAVLVALLVSSSLLAPVSRQADRMLQPVEGPGRDYLIETSKQVGVAFATARLLNAMLSMLEDAEISAELGVGGSVSPGEVLEPVDDLVERFSEVMLVNLVTLTGLLLLGEMGRLVGLALLIPLGIAILAGALWRRPDNSPFMAGIGCRVLILGLFLRLLVPAIGAGSIVLDTIVLQRKQAEAVQKMPEFVRDKVQARTGTTGGTKHGDTDGEGGGSVFFGILDLGSKVKDEIVGMKEDIGRVKQAVPRIVESITEQIAVFVIKSVLLPLVFLWVIIRFYRWLTGDSRRGGALERRLGELLRRREQGGAPSAGTPEASG
jgi:hypothetical protein